MADSLEKKEAIKNLRGERNSGGERAEANVDGFLVHQN